MQIERSLSGSLLMRIIFLVITNMTIIGDETTTLFIFLVTQLQTMVTSTMLIDSLLGGTNIIPYIVCCVS